MQHLQIVKEITEESISEFFRHQDDIDEILDAVENDLINYLPHWMIVILFNNHFLA